MRSLSLAMLLLVVAGCASPSGPSLRAPLPLDATPAPVVADPELADARTRWAAAGPDSYAFTFDHQGPSGLAWNWQYRVVTLEGQTEAVHLYGYEAPPDFIEAMTIDGMFGAAEVRVGASATTEVTYDPVLGYPLVVARSNPTVMDGDSTDSIVQYRPAPDVDPSSASRVTLEALAAARDAWRRSEPGTYEYLWTSADRGEMLDAGESIRVRHEAGETTATPAESHEPADGGGEASMEATFDTIESAVTGGAWVEAVFDPSLGVPLLVAVDPTPAPGDARWIRIRFEDIEAGDAEEAFMEATERWSTARPERYSYIWRFRGDEGERWTYRVAMDGDVADIRGSRDAPRGDMLLAPRISELFHLIAQVRGAGGRVQATYDPELGFPTKVVLPTTEWSSPGTITIQDVSVDEGS